MEFAATLGGGPPAWFERCAFAEDWPAPFETEACFTSWIEGAKKFQAPNSIAAQSPISEEDTIAFGG